MRVRLRARELYSYREILWNLVRKELKVKYTASVLGAVWSLLNPLVFLAVFSFVSAMLGGASLRKDVSVGSTSAAGASVTAECCRASWVG